MPTTRRHLLRTAAFLPVLFSVRADETSWKARCRRLLRETSRLPWKDQPKTEKAKLTSGPQQCLHPEIAKLALGEPIDPGAFDAALAYAATRGDCAEFAMSGVIRILYLFGKDPRISRELARRMEDALLDFRFWLYPDDPKIFTDACYWTENHHVLYGSVGYLAGQMFPNKVFRWTGKTGAWHMDHARKNLLIWLATRARYGFNEWLSPDYYSEDLMGLMNLIDFVRDPELQKAAQGVAELALLDLALHCFSGGIRSSAGRAYFDTLRDARLAATAPVMTLAFDIEPATWPMSGAAVGLATSPKYRPPEALGAIARARPEETVIHERCGMSPEEALALGFRPEDAADIFTFWAMQAYTHPRVFPGILAAQKRWNYNRFTAEPWDAPKTEDNAATAMYNAQVETYRTPDYQVSTAQDYRKGKPAFQQQVWLASLGGAASVWTSHPGADTEDGRPSYWIGNGFLPRAAQYRNLVVLLYRIPAADPRPYTHVYFPVAQFDDVKEQAGWLFGRKADGYIAITARPGLSAGSRKEYTAVERVCLGRECAWICRLGRKAVDGSFERFAERIAKTSTEYADNRLRYGEPEFEAAFGWDGDFVVNGKAIPLTGYPRLESPHVRAPRNTQKFEIACDGRRHTIDLSGLRLRPFREMK
jgi:hypothetical protein